MIDENELQSIRDRALMLRSLHTLGGLGDAELAILAERMRLRYFDSGDILFRETDNIETVYFILDGSVRIERAGATITVLKRGDTAGFFAVLAGDERGVLATVQEATTTFELPAGILTRALRRFPSLLRHFIRISAEHLLASHDYLPIQAPDRSDRSTSRRNRPLTLAERILAFTRAASLSTHANLSAIFEMVLQVSEKCVAAGEVLWNEGDPSETALAIEAGRVRCSHHNGDASMICAPFMLGEPETLADSPRPYRAVAETDLVVLGIRRETFFSVIEAHPETGMHVLALLATRRLGITVQTFSKTA